MEAVGFSATLILICQNTRRPIRLDRYLWHQYILVIRWWRCICCVWC